jgi:transcriptional regulator with XRE-family HTH domain
MRERGLGLRALCREAGLDPSFFSKVLSGKRSPPAEEDALRRVAAALGVDAPRLIVSAGRIPGEWRRILDDEGLFSAVHEVVTGRRPAPAAEAFALPLRRRPAERAFGEELL